MAKEIFVNLPVKDLERSKSFFTKLGYTFNPQFTDAHGACMIISPNIFAMLLTEEFFKTFINREICDTSKATEVITCLSLESRQAVEEMVVKATALGARALDKVQDLGFMYGHGYEDLDGHIWELVYMDQEALKQAQEQQA